MSSVERWNPIGTTREHTWVDDNSGRPTAQPGTAFPITKNFCHAGATPTASTAPLGAALQSLRPRL
eukprot:8958839-Karenia_brevis.AAC.1